jgi:peptidoglycan LD-endopeptidase CwlK
MAPISGKALVYEKAAGLLQRDITLLAPRMREAVEEALAECELRGFDVVINETVRSDQLQRLYYTIGRETEGKVVTYAKSAMYSWHFYGLAIDIRDRAKGYNQPYDWWREVAAIFESHSLDWGGYWRRPDLPHIQWGTLKPSPSDRARELYAEGGLERVWFEVGAL